MDKKYFDWIRKEASNAQNTYMLIRSGMSRSVHFLANHIEKGTYPSFQNYEVCKRVYMNRFNLNERMFQFLLDAHAACIFSVSEFKLLHPPTFIKKAIAELEEKEHIRFVRRGQHGNIYAISVKTKALMDAFYCNVYGISRIRFTEDFVSPKMQANKYTMNRILRLNKNVTKNMLHLKGIEKLKKSVITERKLIK